MQCAILGMGTALPKHWMDQTEAAKTAALISGHTESDASRLGKLYRVTGITRRHSVLIERNGGGPLIDRQSFFNHAADASERGPGIGARMERYEREAGPLAVAAGREALEESGLSPRTVTHVVTVSCSGFTAPGIDTALIQGVELPPGTQRTHVGFMGCHGALNGLRVAKALVESEGAIVLLAAVELCTLHYHYGWDMEKNVANALFADGAAAMLLGPGKGDWRAALTGSFLIPDSTEAMTWRIRDHGFEMTLSQEVPALIQRHVPEWMEQWLARAGLAMNDVKTWAVHPGGPTILRAAAGALGLEKQDLAASWQALGEYGNMSSPTLLFILRALRSQGAELPCVALGFGPGLAAEAVLFL